SCPRDARLGEREAWPIAYCGVAHHVLRRVDRARIVTYTAAAVQLGSRLLGRLAGHTLMLALAGAVAGTATITPVHRAVNQALESLAIDDSPVVVGDSSFVRAPEPYAATEPYFPPPDEKVLETLRPR